MELKTITTAEVMRLLKVKAKVLLRWESEGKLVPISKKGKVGLYYNWQVQSIMIEWFVDTVSSPTTEIPEQYNLTDFLKSKGSHEASKQLEQIVTRFASLFPDMDGHLMEPVLADFNKLFLIQSDDSSEDIEKVRQGAQYILDKSVFSPASLSDKTAAPLL